MSTLHKALEQAVSWSLVPKNVTEAVTPPKPQKKEVRVLISDEIKKRLRRAREERCEALLRTGYYHGDASG